MTGTDQRPPTPPPPCPQPDTTDLHRQLEAIEDDLTFDLHRWLDDARQIESAAHAAGDEALAMRARLIQADVRHRRGDSAAAAPVLWNVNRWATENRHPHLTARSHRLLALLLRSIGDNAGFLEHAVRCVEALPEDANARQRAYPLMMLGDATRGAANPAPARARFHQAEQIATAHHDHQLRVMILNNLAATELDAGALDHAAAAAARMRTVAAEAGINLDRHSSYLDTIANVHLAAGDYGKAVTAARHAITTYGTDGWEQSDALADHLLTLARAQRHVGDHHDAQRTLDHCRDLCLRRGLGWAHSRQLYEQSELHAARGHWRAAWETLKAHHLADRDLMSGHREAQARTRQVLFETAEARADAERFREQARRDPLTGLRNRRYADEELPHLVRHHPDNLTAALVDLDHFKQINDTLSHQIGDRVLVTVAAILTTAVAADTDGFAARVGGEEFLLVLRDHDHHQATDTLDNLRRAVAHYYWPPLTGTLPVTVSIGAATCRRHNAAQLLAAADTHLYTAKNRGRNQTCLDGAPAPAR